MEPLGYSKTEIGNVKSTPIPTKHARETGSPALWPGLGP